MKVNRRHLDEFFRFVYERHMVWHRRFVLKQPPPWTTNRILRDYKFTNMYRELDRGTIWYKSRIPSIAQNDFHNLVWLTIMYRLLNRVETFEKVGFVNCHNWTKEKAEWEKKLKELHKHESVFTNAHLTLPTHKEGKSKISTYMEVLDELNTMLLGLVNEIKYAKSLEHLFDILMQVPCVGRFISYEICCDFILLKVVPFTENDWVNPGPGCKRGINLIFPNVSKVQEYQECIKTLKAEQEQHFKRLKLKFPYLYPDTPMTLRSIEHSLCEYQKYDHMKTGTGKLRMKFKPRDWSNAQGQLPLRFPREAEC